jgi:two-component system, NarL family, sensor histidine kinase DevS
MDLMPDAVPLRDNEDPARLRRLIDIVLAVGSELSLPTMLRTIIDSAVELVDARYGALGVLDPEGRRLSEFITSGMTSGEVAAVGALPEGNGVLGRLIVDPTALRLDDLASHPDSAGFPANHPPMKSFLGVPIRVRGRVFGNLYLTDKQGRDAFSEHDEALVVSLAAAAGLAIERVRLHSQVQDLSQVEDRERIAGELHDVVIQRLFATGLSLQATIPRIGDPEAAARVQNAADDLDDTIRHIRSSIFALQASRVGRSGLKATILALATEAAASLRFEPKLRLRGSLDRVSDSVGDELLAFLRSALIDVNRRPGVTGVDVTIEATADAVVATVAEEGHNPTIVERVIPL